MNLTRSIDKSLEKYQIHKEIRLANTNWLGGKNPFIFLSYFLSSFFLLFVGGGLLYIMKGVSKEEESNSRAK
jgi:hypothetical protein